MPPLFEGQLKQLTLEDLYGNDVILLDRLFQIRDAISEESFELKELALLDRVPKKLGYYYLIFRFEGLWGNGGMQAVGLDKAYDANARILTRTAEAFEFFGGKEVGALIREFVPVASKAQREIDAFNDGKAEATDAELARIWAGVDAYGERYEALQMDHYQAILEDIHKNTQDWLIK
jgi:hypothetical protein